MIAKKGKHQRSSKKNNDFHVARQILALKNISRGTGCLSHEARSGPHHQIPGGMWGKWCSQPPTVEGCFPCLLFQQTHIYRVSSPSKMGIQLQKMQDRPGGTKTCNLHQIGCPILFWHQLFMSHAKRRKGQGYKCAGAPCLTSQKRSWSRPISETSVRSRFDDPNSEQEKLIQISLLQS